MLLSLFSLFSDKERWMAEQVAQQLDEKCKVLETLSNCQREVGTLCALLEKDAESYSFCDRNQKSLSCEHNDKLFRCFSLCVLCSTMNWKAH